jgi:hypothetical protein
MASSKKVKLLFKKYVIRGDIGIKQRYLLRKNKDQFATTLGEKTS